MNSLPLSDDLTLSQFIFGLSDHSVRAKLLALPDLTLQLAVQESLLQETVAAAQQDEAAVIFIKGESSHSERFAVSLPKKKFLSNKNKNSLTSSSSVGAICHSCGRNNHRRADCKFQNGLQRLITFQKFANLQGPQHPFNRFQMASNQ